MRGTWSAPRLGCAVTTPGTPVSYQVFVGRTGRARGLPRHRKTPVEGRPGRRGSRETPRPCTSQDRRTRKQLSVSWVFAHTPSLTPRVPLPDGRCGLAHSPWWLRLSKDAGSPSSTSVAPESSPHLPFVLSFSVFLFSFFGFGLMGAEACFPFLCTAVSMDAVMTGTPAPFTRVLCREFLTPHKAGAVVPTGKLRP